MLLVVAEMPQEGVGSPADCFQGSPKIEMSENVIVTKPEIEFLI